MIDSRYKVIEVDRSGFLSMTSAWGTLLARSSADPLFASWAWLNCWWRNHSADYGLEPLVLAAYFGETLVGLAGFHLRSLRHRCGIRLNRCELIGSLWREPSTVISERTGFIVDSRHPGASHELARALLARPGWGDFVLSYARKDGATMNALIAAAEEAGLYWRAVDPMSAYRIDLSRGFDAWLMTLSQNVRRQLYNKRKRLSGHGRVVWEAVQSADENAFYAELDRMYEARWGWRIAEGRMGNAYREFDESLGNSGRVLLRRLRVGDRTIAVSRAYVCADTLYDVHGAIDPDYDASISPGYLQLGYMIEEAAAGGVRYVDLLGGPGREENYKARLGGEETRLACLQVNRVPLLGVVYKAYDLSRRLLPEPSASK